MSNAVEVIVKGKESKGGAAMLLGGSNTTFLSTLLEANRVEGGEEAWGGAIAVGVNAYLLATSTTFCSNIAETISTYGKAYGGALHQESATADLVGCNIEQNSVLSPAKNLNPHYQTPSRVAHVDGGALFTDSKSTLRMHQCILHGNMASNPSYWDQHKQPSVTGRVLLGTFDPVAHFL